MGRARTSRTFGRWGAGAVALVVLAGGLGLQVAGDRLFRDPGEPGAVTGGIAAGAGLELPPLVDSTPSPAPTPSPTLAPVRAPAAAAPAVVPAALPAPLPAPAPPARLGAGAEGDRSRSNDDVASARNVTVLPYADRADARGREPGEPTGCTTALATAWYRFTPLRDLDVVAQARDVGRTVLHELAVHTGRPDALRLAACDVRKGTVALRVRRGTTYWFQVAPSASARGDGSVVFELRRPGGTRLVSRTRSGAEPDGGSVRPQISADGRTAVYSSLATDVLPGVQPSTCLSARFYTLRALSTVGRVQSGDLPPRGFEPEDPKGSLERNEELVNVKAPCFQVYASDLASGRTTLVSARPDGGGGNGDSGTNGVSLSDDGRYVAFLSLAADLVPGDTNGMRDVFVRDLVLGRTERLSLFPDGRQMHDPLLAHSAPVLSGDGRYVFVSTGALGRSQACAHTTGSVQGRAVNGDTRCSQVYRYDRRTREVEHVSRDLRGRPADGDSVPSGASADGSVVLFHSDATGLVQRGGRAGDFHLYVRDLRRGTTRQVDVRPDGSSAPSAVIPVDGGGNLSADGRWAVFSSRDPELVPGDTNDLADSFLADLRTGALRRVSVRSDGRQSRDHRVRQLGASPYAVSVSRDGSRVVLTSPAADLVRGDHNRVSDVFVHDVRRRTTTLVSLTADGGLARGPSWYGRLSGDRRVLLFAGIGHDGRPVTTLHQMVYARRLR